MQFCIKIDCFVFSILSDSFLNKDIFDSYFVNLSADEKTNEYKIVYKEVTDIESLRNVFFKKMENFMDVVYDVYKGENGIMNFVCDEKTEGEHVYRKIAHNVFEIFALPSSINNVEKWIIRLIREIMLEYYVENGFIPMHSSAVECCRGGVMFVGNKGSGKSTSMMSCVGDGCSIISNDLVFLGIESGRIVIKGWPWCITLGNSLLAETNKFNEIISSSAKTRFLPKDFCTLWNTEWSWKANLYKIVFPKVKPGECLDIVKIEGEKLSELLQQEGSEFGHIPLLFKLKRYNGRFKENYKAIEKKIDCYKIQGDFWKYRIDYKSFILN